MEFPHKMRGVGKATTATNFCNAQAGQARLAQQTGARILLAWGERLAWGRGYRIHLRPVPGTLATEPAAAETTTVSPDFGLPHSSRPK